MAETKPMIPSGAPSQLPHSHRHPRTRTISKEESLSSQTFGSHTLLSKDTLAVQVFHDSGMLKLPPEEDATSTQGTEPKLSVGRIIARDAGLYLSYMAIGMTVALLGVTLLEIQAQTGADIDQLSFLLTWFFLGSLISTLCAGAVFERLHPKFQLCMTNFTMAGVMLTIPWMRNYYVVSFLVFAQGLTYGYTSTSLNAHLFELWKDKTGPFLQALHLTHSVGCMLTPIVAKPFLTVTAPNATNVESQQLLVNGTQMFAGEAVEEAIAIKNVLDQGDTSSRIIHGGTFYPFLIVGLCQLIPAIYSLVQFALDKCRIKRTPQTSKSTETPKTSSNLVMLILFLVVLFCPCGLEASFSGLFYTFTVNHLSWAVDPANLLTMTFWLMQVVCRLVSIFLVRVLKPQTMLLISLSAMMASLVAMATASHVVPLMWIATSMVGFSLGSFVPNCMLYAGTFMSVSGRVAASFMASLYTSAVVMPLCLGLLFKHVGMEWFTYTNIIVTGVMFVMFIVISVVGTKCYPATVTIETANGDIEKTP